MDDGRDAATGPTQPEAQGEQPEDHARLRHRDWRPTGLKVFSSATDAPRARRPTDAVLVALVLLGVVLLSFPAPGPTALDSTISDLIAQLPGLLGWFWEISYDLLIGWALLLLLVAMFAHGRKRLLLDELLAIAFALGFAVLAGNAGGTDAWTSLTEITHSTSPPIYLAVRLALATAVIVTASPHMARPFRYVGRWVITLGAVAGIALGTTLANGMVAGFLIGIGSAALTHLLVGSPGGRPTRDEIAGALQELDVEVVDVHDAPLQPRGVALALATTPDDRSLLVKVFGRDAWDGQLLASTWSSIWNRGGARHAGTGRLQQVEHEAFVTLLAERAGVTVMPVVAAGKGSEGDALLVLEMSGRSLGSLDPSEVDDALLRGYWKLIEQLRDLGVAHGHLDGYRLRVLPDGVPALSDFGDAQIAAPRGALFGDQAQLLVATALLVGSERAVAAAVDAIGPSDLAEVLPYLQPAVLDLATRRAVRDQDWSLKDLRELTAEKTRTDVPALEQVRRVTWVSLAKLAVIGLLIYVIFGAIANVGIDTLISEFQNADKIWLWIALIVTPFVQVPQAFSTMGATMSSVRFGPLLMLEYGVQFIALAVPSSAARVALEIRFFEKVGVPAAGAVAIGMIDSFSTFLIQMLMILVITLSGLGSLNLSSSTSSSSSGSFSSSVNWEALLIAFGLLIVAFIVAMLLPKTRALLHRFRGILRAKAADGRDALKVLRHPSKLLLLFGGNLVAQVMLAIILGLCLRAFGQSASLADLILVNTFVSLFAGFMPVPGGVGVAEAGFTAGLIAIGVPSAAATSTAIAFRVVTFYLPPLWGTFAMRWMRQHSYL